MAARENQGLQISLIVFVFFTVVLSLTTFVFFRNAQNESKRADEAAKSDSATKQQLAKLEQEREDLAKYIGHPATDKHEGISERWDKEMKLFQTFGIANVPDEQKSYLKLVEGLQGVVRTRDTQLAKSNADLREARTLYDTKTAEYEAEKRKLTEEKIAAVEAYTNEQTKMNDLVADLTVSKNQLAADKTAKDKDLAELKTQSDARIGKLSDDLAKMQTQMTLKSQEVRQLTGDLDINAHPDGKITWVNQRDKLAYINLGSDDRLRKRITFTVFDPSTTDVSALPPDEETNGSSKPNGQLVSRARKKGVIEVINVTEPQRAQCRILEHSPTNPILPGDVIYTPLWRPGQQEHFALVGFMDLDGDGAGDRAKIHDLIRVSGGVVDAEVDDKGNVQGAITYKTRYLIRGSSEDSRGISSASGGASAGGASLMGDAEKLGVEVISLAKFLDLIGYKPSSQDELTVSGRVPQPPSAGEPVNNFRARTPLTRGNNGGAY